MKFLNIVRLARVVAVTLKISINTAYYNSDGELIEKQVSSPQTGWHI
jgi:hypothetical protein